MRGLDAVREIGGARFWKKGSSVGAVDEALEDHGPAIDASQRAIGHGQVVVDEVELGVARLREEDLVRVRDGHPPAAGIDFDGGVCHGDGVRFRLPGLRGRIGKAAGSHPQSGHAQLMVIDGMRPETGWERVIAFIVRWLITAAGVWVAAKLVGGIHLDGWQTTLIVALILGALNAVLKPMLVVGTFPLLIMTLGLFLLIINTGLLALTAWICGKFDSLHFAIDSFGAAFWGAVLISVVSFLITRFIDPKRIARSFG